MHLHKEWVEQAAYHRTKESSRLEKTSKIIESSLWLITTTTTRKKQKLKKPSLYLIAVA